MNEVCSKESGPGLSLVDGGWRTTSWWLCGEWIRQGKRGAGVQESGGYAITQTPDHRLQILFEPAQASLAQPMTDCSKVFSTAEQFEIIRTLQNVFKQSGNGHKKTLVKCNQLLAADQLSSWIAVGGVGRGNNKPLD